MVRRSPRQHVEKAVETLARGVDPVVVLDAARRVREAAERREWECARDAREAGVTWKQIGDVYGTSKQNVQQRFGRLPGGRSTAKRSGAESANDA